MRRRRETIGWWDVEVDWYVNCSEGEHGRRAVPLEPALGGAPEDMADMRLDAVKRARRVDRALKAIPRGLAGLLMAAHEHVSPRRCLAAQDAHRQITDRTGELMEAVTLFRRALRGAP